MPNGVSKRGRAILRLVGDIIGEDNARKLRDAYRATTLYIPNCKGALIQARNMALTRDRDMLAGQGMCERDIVFRLAIRYGISDRYIWQILKNPVTIPEEEGLARDTETGGAYLKPAEQSQSFFSPCGHYSDLTGLRF